MSAERRTDAAAEKPFRQEERAAIRRSLRNWYRRTARPLPWRTTRDPYRIWVAEVMLQQTRVAAAEPYYRRFLERFPRVEALAAASRQEVLSSWSGLGYYRRAHCLHEAARAVVERGGFPQDFAGWRALPGVGEYTAAAIASIAFGLPHAVLDGNVLRVLSRLTAERGPIGATTVKRRLAALAAELLDARDPGGFNQALMELGATVCLPKSPECARCPIARHCRARRLGIERQLPTRGPRPKPVRVEKTLLVIERRGRLLLRRNGGGRLEGLWELPEREDLPTARLGRKLGEFRHSITRYQYRITVMQAVCSRRPAGYRWVRVAEAARLPLSAAARKALRLLET